MQVARLGSILFVLSALVPGDTQAADAPFHLPDAVVVNLTEADLNRVLRAAVVSEDGPTFEGTQEELSEGVEGLRYFADISEPVLTLSEGGHMSITFDIREASVMLGRLEKKVAWSRVRCEEFGVRIDPSRPVDVTLDVLLDLQEQDLVLLPETLSLPSGKREWQLIKPSRCRSSLLPDWLIWSLGKPYVRRLIKDLDERLLESARESARSLNDGGLLREDLEISPLNGAERVDVVRFFPERLETGRGSLGLYMAASFGEPSTVEQGRNLDVLPTDLSFVAISAEVLNRLLGLAFSNESAPTRSPGGQLGRLMRSDAIYPLVPGLRGLDSAESLNYRIDYGAAPRVEFIRASDHDPLGRRSMRRGNDALIALNFSDVRLSLWDESDGVERRIGGLKIESGRVVVAPRTSPMGGTSFDTIENEWTVSSDGIEFNESLMAATLQELTFAELFETTYEPIGRGDLKIGETIFDPIRFLVGGDHLVIELTAEGSISGSLTSQANR